MFFFCALCFVLCALLLQASPSCLASTCAVASPDAVRLFNASDAALILLSAIACRSGVAAAAGDMVGEEAGSERMEEDANANFCWTSRSSCVCLLGVYGCNIRGGRDLFFFF